MIPVTQASNCALIFVCTHLRFSKNLTNPPTPPDFSIVFIKAPISSVNMRTLVSPESLKTLIIPSKLSAKPLKGLNSFNSVHPIQIPANREGITCFVLIAKIIAMIGGSTEYHCGSLIIIII